MTMTSTSGTTPPPPIHYDYPVHEIWVEDPEGGDKGYATLAYLIDKKFYLSSIRGGKATVYLLGEVEVIHRVYEPHKAISIEPNVYVSTYQNPRSAS